MWVGYGGLETMGHFVVVSGDQRLLPGALSIGTCTRAAGGLSKAVWQADALHPQPWLALRPAATPSTRSCTRQLHRRTCGQLSLLPAFPLLPTH